MGFAFQADAGNFPASVDPSGSLTQVLVTKVTLVRPATRQPRHPDDAFLRDGTSPNDRRDDADLPGRLHVSRRGDRLVQRIFRLLDQLDRLAGHAAGRRVVFL